MADAFEDHEGTVSIGGRTITNLRFADDIDGLAGTRARAGEFSSLRRMRETLGGQRRGRGGEGENEREFGGWWVGGGGGGGG